MPAACDYAPPMLPRQFSPGLHAALTSLLADPEAVRIAVFDADGTLWRGDATETLLGWLDARGRLARPDGEGGVLGHYDRLCAVDRVVGYTWATEVFAGHLLSEVQEWAAECFEAQMVPQMHAEMSGLVQAFIANGWTVYVVSASPTWALFPGTRRLGVPDANVLAMELDRDGERLGRVVRRPLTMGQGKVQRLAEVLGGLQPSFGAGNSIDDAPMISTASRMGLVIDPMRLPDDATDLWRIAEARGWYVHETAR